MSELEYLKNKKCISFENNEIIINKDNAKNEKQFYVLNHYKFINDKDFKKYYLKEIENSLKAKDYIKKYSFNDDTIALLIYALTFIIFGGIWFYFLKIESEYIKIECIFFILFWLISCITMIFSFRESSLVKTEKGKEIYLKLNGLKNYIKDFGNFDDKSLKEISLWDDYILYVLILNESDNLSSQAKREYNQLVKIIYKK